MTSEHFYMSRTGAIFVLTKLNDRWYLAGNPVSRDSRMLWPVGAATNFHKLNRYIKKQLGFVALI